MRSTASPRELLAAYRQVHAAGKLTMRSHLAFSPDWRGMEGRLDGAAHRRAGRISSPRRRGDDMLRLSGIITEIGRTPDNAVRGQAAPYTGWAGFNYDMGLERRARERNADRLCAERHPPIGIWPNMLDLYA